MIPVKDNEDESCFLVTKHSPWRGKYKRIFSIGTTGVTTYNPSNMEITNRWPYCDFMVALPGPNGNHNQINGNGLSGEFSIFVRSEKNKKDSMRFSTEYRADLLTDLLIHRHQFNGAEKQKDPSCNYPASKLHWSGINLPVTLTVAPASLEQRDVTSNALLASYPYKDIACMKRVMGCPGCHGSSEAWAIEMRQTGRMHLFACSDWSGIKQKITKFASQYLGLNLVLTSVQQSESMIEWENWNNVRLGKFSGDDSLTPIGEYTVMKTSPRHSEPVRRVLCLSEQCLIDRDPQTYQVCSIAPLEHVFCLVRPRDSAQNFTVQLDNGQSKKYTCHERDSVLASLLDTIKAAGNRNVHVSTNGTARGMRWLPLWATIDEEAEKMVLKLIQPPLCDKPYAELLERFSANVPYNGLAHITAPTGIFGENKDKQVTGALETIMMKEGDISTIPLTELEVQFNALRRLLACRVGYCSFTTLPGLRENIGMRVVKSLRRGDESVSQLALELVCSLMIPLHQAWDIRQEQLNKASLLSSPKFLASLLDMWAGHVTRGTGALVVAAMLDVLTFALCVPYSETTSAAHFDQLLGALAERGRCLYKLFQHPCLAIVRGAGLCMKALIEEGSEEVGAKMQQLALTEGALPRHLQSALYLRGPEPRILALRQLSRQLVALWCVNNDEANNLLRRILPNGLLNWLESDEKAPETSEEHLNTRDNLQLVIDDMESLKPKGVQKVGLTVQKNLKVVERHVEHALQHWGARMGLERLERLGVSGPGMVEITDTSNLPKPVALRLRRELVKSKANWPLVYSKFWLDHALPDLIWNHRTREELREALQQELTNFASEADLTASTMPDAEDLTVSWNYREFEVTYASLSDEIKIGDYYLRLLLERDHEATLQASLGEGTAVGSGIKKASKLFTELYHRFLLSTARADMRAMCLQAMSIVYGQHYEELKPFSDMKFLVAMLDKSVERSERDRIVLFLRQLVRQKSNCQLMLDAGLVKSLVDLVTLSHLHTNRAMVPSQSNVLEAGPGMTRDQEKEWYYEVNNERRGPVSYKDLKELFAAQTITARTKCWAQGMESWRLLHQVPQLKWGLLARGEAVLDESQLAHLALGILIQLCEYSPSRENDGSVIRPLPRVKREISDPSLLPHVVQLLLTFDPKIVESVATILNLVMADNPAATRLYLSGAFYFVLMYTGSNVLPIARFLSTTHTLQACSRVQGTGSILSPLLPDAMVHFLINHGPEKFAEIFLGEFDTPEAIWSSEMRRHLCERLAAHLADFSPRLSSNTRAIYSHCVIPEILYPQLDRELFCGSFYLRHLCDEIKFPNWPIAEPVSLLRDVLLLWKREVEKKPPAMSTADALRELGILDAENVQESDIRKAYFVNAQKFHPDKNPAGRERFEAVNKAYEFLCSKDSREFSGPNPDNIVLILRTQSILFRRYKSELSPYKYAGYPQLIKTIKMETSDEGLFSKQVPLLASASELAYYTVDCCSLNAEELRREGGIDSLLEALSRCVAVLSKSAKPQDVAVKVCCNVVQTLGVCAKSQACRDKMVELPRLVWELCSILQWQHLIELACHTSACVASLAADSILQMALVQSGAMWPALKSIFGFDYTLEEGGVTQTESTNNQALGNRLARLSLKVCAALSGYPPPSPTTSQPPKEVGKKIEELYPANPVAQKALDRLLTPFIAHQLNSDTPDEILKILNSNIENPYLIWDNGTRAQLNDFVEEQRTLRRDPNDPIDPSIDLAPVFDFSAHCDELVIGGVFIRIYNEQPSFPIQKPKGFVLELLEYLRNQSKKLQSVLSDDKIHIHSHMALRSLANVLKCNPGVELQLIGHFKLLSWLLVMPNLQPDCLQVLNTACSNLECVNDLAVSEVLHHILLTLLGEEDEVISLCLDCLHTLASSPKAVKEALAKGAVLYLLCLFCNSGKSEEVRGRTAELLSRLSADRLSGPKVKLVLSRFLPAALSDIILGSPRMAMALYDGNHENPELVWGSNQRNLLEKHLNETQKEFSDRQRIDVKAEWKAPDTDFNYQSEQSDELVVGGVYLRLFSANPGWSLKRPKHFLGELLDTTIELMARETGESSKMDLAIVSLVSLLATQPKLAEVLPSLGHLPKLVQTLVGCVNKGNNQATIGAVKVFLHLSKSQGCVEALRNTDCVSALKLAMQKYPQSQGFACETLGNWFSAMGSEPIIRQAVQIELVPYLLGLLQSPSSVLSAAHKAHLVHALKALKNTSNPQLAEKISAMLDKCPGWAEFRDQKHDLFLGGPNEQKYLEAPSGMMGYLTDGRGAAKLPDQPPPLMSPSESPSSS
ncbi:dnaJ homolog subfamily C member 13 [Neocloeon triangulifer]|uniref:dnaJ homolog subfamily C member 13 n=1 Tax=Neocloeon triangulifer TaxID=2078957 RepID=UPI00286F3EBF|nr:dnaJ homolog subfamily C member 13 [Neocloeon triangulifer]